MKIKSFAISTLLIGFMLCLAAVPYLNAQETQEKQQPDVVIIPKEVKAIFQEGMDTRQARMDIPFTFEKHLYLPAQQNLHNIFFFKAKNADLGFIPVPAEAQVVTEEGKAVTQESQAKLQAKNHVFLQFDQLDGTFTKEVYIPADFEADQTTFDPEREEIYSTGYPLPSGKFLLSMAITSDNLEKVGTQYFEFDLPNPAAFVEGLGITPIFFAKNINRMSSPELRTDIHKDYFTYSILQVYPNHEHVFSVGENLDIFFFIFGAQSNEQGKNDITVNYEVVQGEEKIVKFAPTNYDMPLISQPLPMKKTIIVKTTKGEETSERKESQDIEPGEYTLTIDIKCNISGKTLKKDISFSVE